MIYRLICFFLICTFSLPALAHPGHGGNGLMYGLLHPLTGIDHLLVMLAVGVLGGRFGGSLRWQLPAMFVSMMAVGILLGVAGLTMPWLETVVATSVMVVGLLLMTTDISARMLLALVPIAGVFHGMAHGLEATSAAGVETVMAMLVSTAMLHVAGLLIAFRLRGCERVFHRLAGTTMLVTGLGLLVS